jgi:hypothetical protein
MSWTVFLEDENRTAIKSLGKEFIIKSLNDFNCSDFKLIKYIDPYGDTVFNHLQMSDLIADFEIVAKLEPENELIDIIVQLAKQCLEQSHLYLVFYGD